MLRAFVTLVVVAVASVAAAGRSDRILTKRIEMTPGMLSHYLTDLPIKEVVVGKFEVADVSVVTDHSVTISAKEHGDTTILMFGEDRQLVDALQITVVPLERGLGRRAITVRSIMKDYQTHTYNCEMSGHPAGGPCVFDKSSSNRVAAPVISTGPIITSGPVVQGKQ